MDSISRQLNTLRRTNRCFDWITQARLHDPACIATAPKEHGRLAAFVDYLVTDEHVLPDPLGQVR